VPVDQFETVQRRMRALAVQVLNDTASGQGVRTEYVDTQSRATHLEATAARIREFLKQAQDVDGESRPVGTGYDLARTSFGTESTCRW